MSSFVAFRLGAATLASVAAGALSTTKLAAEPKRASSSGNQEEREVDTRAELMKHPDIRYKDMAFGEFTHKSGFGVELASW